MGSRTPCPSPPSPNIDDYAADTRIIEQRWLSPAPGSIALHPNHEHRIRSDIHRLVMIVREQQQLLAEAGVCGPRKTVTMSSPSINKFSGQIRCSCGRWFKDKFCPVHREDGAT